VPGVGLPHGLFLALLAFLLGLTLFEDALSSTWVSL